MLERAARLVILRDRHAIRGQSPVKENSARNHTGGAARRRALPMLRPCADGECGGKQEKQRRLMHCRASYFFPASGGGIGSGTALEIGGSVRRYAKIALRS